MTDTDELLAAIAERQNPRLLIACFYAIGLRMDFGQIDWGEVNRAIIDRWSISSLKWVKRNAWRILAESEAY